MQGNASEVQIRLQEVVIGDSSKRLRVFALAVGKFPVWSRRLTPRDEILAPFCPGR